MRLPAFVPLLLLATATAHAADGQAADPDRKICRQAEAKTGSFMRPKRECHTLAEWNAMKAAERTTAPPIAPPQIQLMDVGNQR